MQKRQKTPAELLRRCRIPVSNEVKNHSEQETPAVALVDSVLEEAISMRASDIHLEPMKDRVRIRYRIDGSLTEYRRCGLELFPAIAARIKIISGMDISERRLPQDGRMSAVVKGKEYSIRVSSMPTVRGEKLVMQFVGQERLMRNKEELGMDRREIGLLNELLSHPCGLVLATGPTGCGKSTTLYTALGELNSRNLNIMTVEDPVEAEIEGVNQVQINPKIKMGFAGILRSILRQDPDVIMIGEIRDEETAQIAVQAALTGHLVLSTLHTGDTAGSISRMLNMGVKPYLLADALTGVVAQRLCRKLCSCKKMREEVLSPGNSRQVWEPVGCEKCGNTGYYDRTGVYEVMKVSRQIRELIGKGAPAALIKEEAVKEGLVTLRESAEKLVEAGVTSVEEMHKIGWEDL